MTAPATAPRGLLDLSVSALAVEACAANAQIHLAEGSHCRTAAGKRGAEAAALEQLRAAYAAAGALIAEMEARR